MWTTCSHNVCGRNSYPSLSPEMNMLSLSGRDILISSSSRSARDMTLTLRGGRASAIHLYAPGAFLHLLATSWSWFDIQFFNKISQHGIGNFLQRWERYRIMLFGVWCQIRADIVRIRFIRRVFSGIFLSAINVCFRDLDDLLLLPSDKSPGITAVVSIVTSLLLKQHSAQL